MKDIIISLLAIINLILYLLVIAVWLIIPDYFYFNLSLTLLNFTFSGLIAYFNFKEIYQYAKSPFFKKLMSETLSIFLLFCILGVVNYLSFRNFWQFDLTKNNLNTLTEQSIKLVSRFKEPLEIKVFAGKGDQAAYLKLLDLYKMHKRDIDVDIIDPEIRPDLVKKYGVTKYGTLLLISKDQVARAETSSELDITKGIYKLTRHHIPQIGYIVGHEEDPLNSKEDEGLLYLKTLLDSHGYQVKELNLLSLEFIPDEIDLLMIWGPKRDYTESEILKIKDFVNRGKRIIFSYNPDFSSFKLNNLKEFFKNYGVILNNDLVMDQKSFVAGSNGMIPLINIYNKEHPITKNFREQTFFPLSNSLEIDAKKKENFLIEELILSSPQGESYSKLDLKDIINQKNSFDQKKDKIGPRTLMLSVYEKGILEGRDPFKMVIIGCSTLILNKYKNYGAQFNLILNAISWLSDEEFSITVDRMNVSQNPVYLNSYQVGFLFYFSIVVGPLILFLSALYFYVRRKKL